ncbi:hypothetical protein [Mucilaginibacter ginsenosidivorax]|uniref:Uncharacterized protein n=1 Tax=Mucilaginibacter ginsenosidivorax TaxID=862126 RepID=A0A5B8W537_9SPHI|nr:hypothetical protein [Mucilaginibacter ginsenosidivorax]QEC78863.1 hypothetical protein FSB76_24005 [Mucilaginibacter ginsenosidivorax]
MKKSCLLIVTLLIVVATSNEVHAQLKVRVVSGIIDINDGPLYRNANKYASLSDSLDKNLKANPKDTTSLFFRALLYLKSNDVIAKPYQRTKGTLENLTIAKNMAEKAVSLKMQDFNLKVLRAEIYKELVYRFTGDESWMFNSKQKNERKALFNNYKELANKYYDELIQLDNQNAYDYEKLKIKDNYPL